MLKKLLGKSCQKERLFTLLISLNIYILLMFLSARTLADPVFKFEQNSLNLGKLTDSSKVKKFSIPFYNNGTETLEIDFVKSRCNCVTIESFDKKISPGEKGEIVVAIDPSKSAEGQNTQILVLKTNDPNMQYSIANIYYRIKLGDVVFSPKAIKLTLSNKDARKSFGYPLNSVFVLDLWDKRLEISDINKSPHLMVDFFDIVHRCLQCERRGDVHLFRFDMRLTSDIPVGPISEWIGFTTNHPKYPMIKIPITGKVQSRIKVFPKVLLYRSLSTLDNLERNIQIIADSDSDILEIEQVRPLAQWLSVKKVRVDERRIDLNVLVDTLKAKAAKESVGILKTTIILNITKPDVVEQHIEVMVLSN